MKILIDKTCLINYGPPSNLACCNGMEQALDIELVQVIKAEDAENGYKAQLIVSSIEVNGIESNKEVFNIKYCPFCGNLIQYVVTTKLINVKEEINND